MALFGSLDQVDIKEIAAQKSDNAVDVFVYDTSRDSDGGAWRKRTQHTSWYNEPLNTSTRGSRREFPAVAVIVQASTSGRLVNIYDGDDPDLPFWGNHAIHKPSYSASDATAVTARNGVVIATDGSGYGGYVEINYAADKWEYYGVGQGGSGNGFFRGKVFNEYVGEVRGDRNEWWIYEANGNYLASRYINDVAMTVLPGAPIDEATGLPVPTIAIATDGGVSVIKDDGTVVDITQNQNDTNKVSFLGSSVVAQKGSVLNADMTFLGIFDIPQTDQTTGANNFPIGETYSSSTIPSIYSGSAGNNNGIDMISSNQEVFIGRESSAAYPGLSILDTKEDKQKEMICNVSSSYNTGWMNGDIKGAFLSDTDDTDLVEELANTDVSDWSNTGAANWTFTSATELSVDVPSGKGGVARLSLDTTKKYIIEFDLDSFDDNLRVRSDVDNDIITIYQNDGTGSYSVDIPFGSSYVELVVYQTDNASLSNVAVRVADRDRSVNNNGLIVNGTVTRSPVAPGADLVAYSGFSGTNYLEQPYNPDLNFGTGDFCYMAWAKWDGTDSSLVIISRSSSDGQDDRIDLEYNGADNKWNLYTRSNGNAIKCNGQSASVGVWTHLIGLRRNGILEFYQNGVLINTASQSSDLTDTHNSPTRIGLGVYNGNNFGGSIALTRISATAPTAEQIKRIYEDEKFLFQENAQATLYGNSDAVTALAHDEVTDLLHVGTSDGRSVFQGLRRVDNTTTAVNSAISAINNIIAED